MNRRGLRSWSGNEHERTGMTTIERWVYGDNILRCRREEHYPSRDVLAQDEIEVGEERKEDRLRQMKKVPLREEGDECREALRAHVVWHDKPPGVGTTGVESTGMGTGTGKVRGIECVVGGPSQYKAQAVTTDRIRYDGGGMMWYEAGGEQRMVRQTREPKSRPERSIFGVKTTAPRESRNDAKAKGKGKAVIERVGRKEGKREIWCQRSSQKRWAQWRHQRSTGTGHQWCPHHQLPPRQSQRRSTPRTSPLLGSEAKGRETVKKRHRSGGRGDARYKVGHGHGHGPRDMAARARYDVQGTLTGPGKEVRGTRMKREEAATGYGEWYGARAARKGMAACARIKMWTQSGRVQVACTCMSRVRARERAQGTGMGAGHGNGRGARERARGTGMGAGHGNGRGARERARYERGMGTSAERERARHENERGMRTSAARERARHENERGTGTSAARERARHGNEHGTGWVRERPRHGNERDARTSTRRARVWYADFANLYGARDGAEERVYWGTMRPLLRRALHEMRKRVPAYGETPYAPWQGKMERKGGTLRRQRPPARHTATVARYEGAVPNGGLDADANEYNSPSRCVQRERHERGNSSGKISKKGKHKNELVAA
ncbi:hypothetical protein B0H16DRAFT_1704732 [Mycena metata]|uniref:Uncharacterized protein n=1 Tax=Mycena metata TaxID=1033252 RepID=A0AAD7GT91_9AGAR|nr:hypothetical protein B0H16DRAFT_1704732 [Mycena metata]